MTDHERALRILLARGPWHDDDATGGGICFWCDCRDDDPGHEPDCAYVLATSALSDEEG